MRSTITALLHLSNTALSNVDNSLLSILVALDFSKAFNTVNHELLAKLHLYGLSLAALSFLHSYITNRFQYMFVHNPLPMFSSPYRVSSDVPQAFTANATLLPLTSRLYIYADNILLENSFKHNEVRHPFYVILCKQRPSIYYISDWSASNGLHLNASKSFYMIIAPRPSYLVRLL